MKPIVVIVGRPNVGKSTLFNRVTRTRNAVVADTPGVTRDRNYAEASWNGFGFILVDTGGFLADNNDSLTEKVRFQLFKAMEEADVILHIMDGKYGVSPYDKELVDLIRISKKPTFYVVNKIDGPEQESNVSEFHQLGIDKLYPVSAAHGYGMHELLDHLVSEMPESEPDDYKELTKIAVVGRPNVGKSSLINRIIGEERLLVSDTPGTTRDAIDTVCEINGTPYLFIDTAGIRRKGRVKEKIETFSILRALKSMARCDIALVLLDASEGITDQDVTIAGYTVDRGCGCIFLFNKWDMVHQGRQEVNAYSEQLRYRAKFLSFAPILTISAKTGLGVSGIFRVVDRVYEQYGRRISTARLNRILQQAVEQNQPPFVKGKRLRFYYITQLRQKPPTFVCFTNYPDEIHFSYHRYLVNQIRTKGGLDSTPIRLYFRKKTSGMNR
ncbi:MAG: ribosome biogenesis GTPase Der [Deltaproteobacteria bacterium]|nr:ribosome biogenesis GTPase Der [Deltaproteobacteria bacterium]